MSRPLFLFDRAFHLLRRGRSLPDTMFDHFLDALRNAAIALHQRMQIVRVEPQQVGTRDRGNGCAAACPPQQCDFSEKLAGTEPDSFFFSSDFDLDLVRQ